jgi:hypothetical protein
VQSCAKRELAPSISEQPFHVSSFAEPLSTREPRLRGSGFWAVRLSGSSLWLLAAEGSHPRILPATNGITQRRRSFNVYHSTRCILLNPAFVTTIPDGTDLVFDTVNELREQRMMMVKVKFNTNSSILSSGSGLKAPTWVGTRHAQEPLIEPSAITSSSIDTGAGEHQAQPGKKRKYRHG